MLTWSEFAAAAPDLAAYGAARFNRARVAYIATVAEDGSPRINPVQPVVCTGRLLLFVEPNSPKLDDLICNGQYALHSLVDNPVGQGGEFSVMGRAECIDDPAMRARAEAASCFTPPGEYLLFELKIDAALARDYAADEGEWSQRRWDYAPAPA